MPAVISIQELTRQLLAVGVTPGVLLVHTSFSRVGPVEDGPRGLIAALLASVRPSGTVVMPSMSDDDDHPFDPVATPCAGMGIVAETFWRLPGVLRSDSPHAFAAIGPQAEPILAPHPIDVPHGLDSPVGRVYEQDGQVLLLGVGHDANTMIHLAESLAGVRYRQWKHAMTTVNGQVTRVEYGEIDHCCERFRLMDAWLDVSGRQIRGPVGNAGARLMRARDVVDAAVVRLRDDPTVFLHPPGVDAECDSARGSL